MSFYLDRRWLSTVPATELATYPAPADIIANQAVTNYGDLATWPGSPTQPQSALVIDYIKVYKLRKALPAPARQKP